MVISKQQQERKKIPNIFSYDTANSDGKRSMDKYIEICFLVFFFCLFADKVNVLQENKK